MHPRAFQVDREDVYQRVASLDNNDFPGGDPNYVLRQDPCLSYDMSNINADGYANFES